MPSTYLTEEEKIISLCEELFNSFAAFRTSNYEQAWINSWKMFNCYVDKNRYPLRSKVFVPHIFSGIVTLVPRLVEALFSQDDMVNIQGGLYYSEEHGRRLEYLINLQYKLQDYFWEYLWAVLDMEIFGVAWQKTGWGTIGGGFSYKHNPTGGEPLQVPSQTPPYVGPITRFKSCWDVYPEPSMGRGGVGDLNLIDRMCFTGHELEDLETRGVFKNVKDLPSDPTYGSSSYFFDRLGDLGYSGGGFSRISNDPAMNRYEVLQYWLKDYGVITIGERKILLRWDKKNPLWHGRHPYQLFKHLWVGGEVLSRGIVPFVTPLQLEQNALRNLRLQLVKQTLMPLWLVTDDSVEDTDLIWWPDGAIRGQRPDGVVPMRPPNVPMGSYQEDALLKDNVYEPMGATDTIRGVPSARGEPATTSMLRDKAASGRIGLDIRCHAQAVKEITRQRIDLNRQALISQAVKDPRSGEIFDMAGEEIMEAQAYTNLTPVVSSQQVRELYQLRLKELWGMMASMPFINLEGLAAEILDAHVLDGKRFIKTQAQMLQEMQQAQTAGMAAAGGGSPFGGGNPFRGNNMAPGVGGGTGSAVELMARAAGQSTRLAGDEGTRKVA